MSACTVWALIWAAAAIVATVFAYRYKNLANRMKTRARIYIKYVPTEQLTGQERGFCRKVAFSRVWESVSHCIPDTRFLDFAQQSNVATEPWYAVGGVHLGPVEKLLCCRKLATGSVCNMTGLPPALHRTGPACLCVTGSTPRAPHGAGTDGVWSRPAAPAAAPAHG